MAKATNTAQLEQANVKIADLEKQLASAQQSLKYANNRASELSAEVDAVHDVLDTLQGAPLKRAPDGYSDRKLMTRLAGYFATGFKP